MGFRDLFSVGDLEDGAVKEAPTFCCLGDTVNLGKIQGAKEDDVSVGPAEFNCNGANTWVELRCIKS